MARLDARLAALESMPTALLRMEWQQLHDDPAPNLADDLLRMGIAYRLQEKAAGGLSRKTSKALRDGRGGPAPRQMKPGTRLMRDWNGRTVNVVVTEAGFSFEDRAYKSLSAIAREVTGTAWSGPRFFGLKDQARG